MAKQLGVRQLKLIDQLVNHFIKNKPIFVALHGGLNSIIESDDELKEVIHSHKSRIKDAEHLRDKLMRKAHECIENGEVYDYTVENLFAKINDLVGFRILHLHTTQFEQINIALNKIFAEQRWQIVEGPNARIWDEETKAYFEGIGVATSSNSRLYTSVHYILKPNTSTPITCEIQVRTLSEEVWGEVDHKINYPHKSDSHSCREQIKTLARVTSSCSRLVDSIFSTYNHELAKAAKSTIQETVKEKRKKT
jgi:ppGpp synthetase/RelA/SpoT-type nucleotidyltranferase